MSVSKSKLVFVFPIFELPVAGLKMIRTLLVLAALSAYWTQPTAAIIATGFCNDKVGATTPLVKGDQTYFCVNINDQYRAVFAPIVDQYVQLRLHDSYIDQRMRGNTTTASTFLTVSSMKTRSVYKMFTNGLGKAYPILTAVVTVKQGEIQGISWDDGCYLCDYTSCDSNLYAAPNTALVNSAFGDGSTCYHSPTQCVNQTALCDLSIYVGWTGTDANGNYLSSAGTVCIRRRYQRTRVGMRISQFQKYSVNSYISDFTNKLSTLLPRF
ncbi:Aste57867_21401 [Aphanomyces stellatus]|uniref:Aste57867_21401 protein n=1 Tax=Aphanomyces stellatus TaxID=120398 RepID=A0A485LLZ5_9STRA|nr:hypothetical protein As57867_021332 [Aphanomyces stellatus]VFT98072.1 Aste57867_21401 [Aphanomyces stellatus]